MEIGRFGSSKDRSLGDRDRRLERERGTKGEGANPTGTKEEREGWFSGSASQNEGGEFGWMEGREIVWRRSTKFETNFADRRIKTI